MPATPPAALGRGVVVRAGCPVPTPWAGAPVVTVDEAALADPAGAVGALHRAWAARSPVVVALAVDPARFRTPRSITVDEPWRLAPGDELWHDRLHFLVWANTYDARDGEPIWWWGRKAARLGAVEHGPGERPGDVTLPDGTPAWVDGGPRGGRCAHDLATGAAVAIVHAESVERGSLTVVPPREPAPGGALAPDQLAAVAHGAGPARVIAPAGSGKTRVLTERLRHLVVDRGYEPGGVVAVAYNRRARDEMVARTSGVGARILTLNALGYEIVAAGLGRRPDVIEVRDVRRLLEPLVPPARRTLNTDPLGPYVEALAEARLGLRDPVAIAAERGDVPGLAEAFPRYRAELARRRVVDFDEQVLLAVELLLGDGDLRRAQQARHRHLLVDEFQDLTPAHVLLVRLLSAPRFDVFGVGDDDQVVYGHAGASPEFLTGFERYFPGAHEHALEVNYRCPASVVAAASNLLTRNTLRVPKRITAAAPRVVAGRESSRASDVTVDGALAVQRHPPQAGARVLVDTVVGWLERPGVRPADVAVLTRVGSLLLAPHVALVSSGVPMVDAVLGPDVLDRTGLRAALAYLRIAAEPGRIDPRDLVEIHRRPSRGLPRWVDKWLGRCRDIGDIERAARRIDDARVSGRLTELAGDLGGLAGLARGGTTRAVLEEVRDGIGLGRAVEQLDSSAGRAGQSHGDDLEALVQVADLHTDPGGFEPWLRGLLARPGDPGGVTLSTVHRVKGREWPQVAVFGVADGVMPHRLAHGRLALEEERRVFHVAITRGIDAVAVLGDAVRPSPFLAELDAPATDHEVASAHGARHREEAAARRHAASAGAQEPRPDPAVEASLRHWRSARSRADGVPAYVVLSNNQLAGIAGRCPTDLDALARCPGIGPKRLAAYGAELVERVREALASS